VHGPRDPFFTSSNAADPINLPHISAESFLCTFFVKDLAPATEVAKTFEVNMAQVYLAKHRVAALVKKEVRSLEAKMG
jgi:hypothetical protein